MNRRQYGQRLPGRLFALALDKVPKLAPDPVAAPVANGVENDEAPVAGAEPNNGAVFNVGVEAGNEPKSDGWGEAPDDPNKEDAGADVVGVENSDDAAVAADGVAKSVEPPPDEAAPDVGGAVEVPGVAELVNKPAT